MQIFRLQCLIGLENLYRYRSGKKSVTIEDEQKTPMLICRLTFELDEKTDLKNMKYIFLLDLLLNHHGQLVHALPHGIIACTGSCFTLSYVTLNAPKQTQLSCFHHNMHMHSAANVVMIIVISCSRIKKGIADALNCASMPMSAMFLSEYIRCFRELH